MITLLLLAACGPGPALCDGETRAEPIGPGATFASERYTVTLPVMSPRAVRVGDNAWSVRVEPTREDCDLLVEAFAPDSGDLATPGLTTPIVPGTWIIEALTLPVPGYWELTFRLACAHEDVDITGAICVDP